MRYAERLCHCPLFQSPIKGVAKNVWHDRQKKSVTAQQPPPISRLIGSNADKVLEEVILKELGDDFKQVVNEYKKVPKWYA